MDATPDPIEQAVNAVTLLPLHADANLAVLQATTLAQTARLNNSRRSLLIQGEAATGHALAQRVIQALAIEQPLILGGAATRDQACQALQVLGRDTQLLVFDAHQGLDPDALAAATGSLVGGGLLLLLTPPLDRWPSLPDPLVERLQPHPAANQRPSDQIGSRYLARLCRLLSFEACPHPSQTQYSETPDSETSHKEALHSKRLRLETPHRQGPQTQEQARAVAAICELSRSPDPQPLLITADRGRGKSAALGLAAWRLLKQDPNAQILVTAPRYLATDNLFRHAANLPGLRFVAPDALLSHALVSEAKSPEAAAKTTQTDVSTMDPPPATLLLIDEAAGIPLPLLEQLLHRFPRIVFSTTTHGYEGTGRGFEIRFREMLDRLTPSWQRLHLEEPIRWAIDDPLERWLDQALLLDAEPLGIADGNHRFLILDRDRLAQDEALLRQVFGLLMLAHYQTRPMDLRHLLDAPNLKVAALMRGSIVIATALLATEGCLPEDLINPIFDGKRRPRGHLLPQSLSAQAGLIDAPRLGFARMLRIAVHPELQRQGLGRQLILALTEHARQQGLDLIGASFGATTGLIRFWRQCGLMPVHLGTRRNAASGTHAAIVLQGLNRTGAHFLALARARFPNQLRVLQQGPVDDLCPELTKALLADSGKETIINPAGHVTDPGVKQELQALEARDLQGFAWHDRAFESALPALHRFACHLASHRRRADPIADADAQPMCHDPSVRIPTSRLSGLDRALFERALIQLQPPETLAPNLGLSGRRALIQHIRQFIRQIILQ